jgi:hypothetical protein
MAINHETKVTLKNAGLDKKILQESATEQKQAVCRILGKIKDITPVDGTHGTSMKFMGIFEATNLITGEITRGPNLFVPEVVEGILTAEVEKAKEADENAAIGFGIDITIQANESPIGYKFGATPVIESKQEDPFADLKAMVKTPLPKPEVKATKKK